jgi:YD repeat-containing protein
MMFGFWNRVSWIKKALRLQLLICCLTEAASAATVDFYWRMYNYGAEIGQFSTPTATCQAWAPYVTNAIANDPKRDVGQVVVYSSSGDVQTAVDKYTCNYKVTSTRLNTGKVTTSSATQKVYRTGTSCPSGSLYDSNTGVCFGLGGSTKGVPGVPICSSSEINFINGNIFDAEVDFSDGSLVFGRNYNSYDGVMRHGFSTRLQVSGSNVTRVASDGKEYLYNLNGVLLSAGGDNLGKLTKLSVGWSYVSADNEVSIFDAAGVLQQQISSQGRRLVLARSDDVITVTDERGRSVNYSEDAQYQPLTFSSPGISLQYSYNSNNHLIKITRTLNGYTQQRQFHYEDARNGALLTGITDERGIRSSTWTYDEKGRATSSLQADGVDLTQVTYNEDGTSTVTNALGKKTVYHFTDVGGFKKVSAIEGEPSANCPASNSTFTYNDRGQVLTQTDAKGFITTHTYNDRGLETTRTEASGTPQARTTTTTWHATFNLPLTVIEGGQVTTYTYDAHGRQTSRKQHTF